jgi:hypothetical protein
MRAGYYSGLATAEIQIGAYDVAKLGMYVAGATRHGVYVAGATRHGVYVAGATARGID